MNLGMNACFYQRKSTGQVSSKNQDMRRWLSEFLKDVSIDIDILNTRQRAFT